MDQCLDGSISFRISPERNQWLKDFIREIDTSFKITDLDSEYYVSDSDRDANS